MELEDIVDSLLAVMPECNEKQLRFAIEILAKRKKLRNEEELSGEQSAKCNPKTEGRKKKRELEQKRRRRRLHTIKSAESVVKNETEIADVKDKLRYWIYSMNDWELKKDQQSCEEARLKVVKYQRILRGLGVPAKEINDVEPDESVSDPDPEPFPSDVVISP
jgi:hypothetical protein